MSLATLEVSQSPVDKYREYLAKRGKSQHLRGPQRALIQHIFSKHNHFDPEQLYDDVKSFGHAISRATVYRTLTKLVDAELLRRLEVGTRVFYEHDYGYPHHEHLICQRCEKM